MAITFEDVEPYVDFIVDLFFPLIAAVEDPDEASRLLIDLGYFPASTVTAFKTLSPVLTKLQELIVTLEQVSASGDDDKTSEVLLDILSLAAEVFRAVDAITTALQQNFAGSGLLTDTDILATIARKLADYLVVRFLEAHHPVVHAGLLLVGIIELEEIGNTPTPFHASHLKRTVRWDRIPAYFSDPLNTLTANLVDAQGLRYRALIYFLYNLGAGLGYYTSFVRPDLDVLATFNEGHDLSSLIQPPSTRPLSDDEVLTPFTDIDPLASLSFPLTSNPAAALGLLLYPVMDPVSHRYTGVGLGLRFGGELQIPLGDAYQIALKFSATLADSLGVRLDTTGKFTFINQLFTANPAQLADDIQFGARVSIAPTAAAAELPLFSLGVPQGSRFEIGSGALALGIEKLRDFALFVEADIRDGLIVLKSDDADGFLSKLLPADGITAGFSLGVGFSNRAGMYFKGSSSLVIRLPLHVALGPINLDNLTIALTFDSGRFPLTLATGISAELGPLQVVVEDVGVRATFEFKADRSGNMGPLDVSFGFKPPKGVGLAVDAGAVKGGGYLYFDFEKEEYAGVLELAIANFITLTAIGLVTTRMPDGSKGFSLLIIITAEFGTGMQLGLGFTLIGVGGLLGLNRTVKLQPLADGVRTGAVNNIMFPKNVVANAPRIISDLRAIFPVYVGKFLIGPMAKLGWGSPPIITLSLGVIIEIPGNLAILGVLKLILPDLKAPVLVLQVAFVGAIEFDKKRLWLFAGLFDSKILTFTIEGEMGVLFAWGDTADFVLSVGGFHPRFKPPPLPFPSPKRLAICILDEDQARIRISTYFAVTTNTVQFGARAELFFGFSAISVEGHFQFDALFQFSPFYFVIELGASVSLKVFGMGVFSISLELALEGPTPWHARGRGSISFFFFSVSANFDETWGEEKDTTLPPIEVFPLLAEELAKEPNWSALPPKSGNLLVSLRVVGDTKEFVLHPVGTLRITQRTVPLNSKIDLLGTQKPADANRFALAVKTPGLAVAKTVREEFAPAQFHDMSRNEKLAAPAFSQEDGGFDISATGDALRSSLVVRRIVRYEQIIIDTNFKRFQKRFAKFAGSLFRHFLGGNATARSALSARLKNQMQPFKETIATKSEGFGVAQTSNNMLVLGTSVFGSYHAAKDYVEQAIAQNPELAGMVHIVPEFEINEVV